MLIENELKAFDLSYFRDKFFFGNDVSQNMFVYQPTLETLKIKYEKTSENVTSWKSKGVYNSNLKPLHGALLPHWKYAEKKISVNLNKSPLVVQKNNYSTKIVNAYIVYDLDNWPKVPLRNFTLKNCLLGSTNIIKNSDKEKYVYSGYGIAFDRKGFCSFGNYYARNVIIFGVDSSSSSHTDNQKMTF